MTTLVVVFVVTVIWFDLVVARYSVAEFIDS
jgi:hypothetical protein